MADSEPPTGPSFDVDLGEGIGPWIVLGLFVVAVAFIVGYTAWQGWRWLAATIG